MRLVIEGWRYLPHSYSVVAQQLALELAARPGIELRFRDVPFINPAIVPSPGLLNDDELARHLSAIPTASDNEPADATVRCGVPLNLTPTAGRTLIFGTTEFGIADPRLTTTPALMAMNAQRDIALLTSSEWSRSGLIRSGADPDKVVVAPLGFDPNRFRPATAERRAELRRRFGWGKAFVFLNVGALTANKGIAALLAAFAPLASEFPQARLALKGLDAIYVSSSGLEACRNTLSAAQRAAIQGRVDYLGQTLSADDMAGLYQAADAYVTPYRAEGFNLPALEGVACGLPLICTAGGPTDEFTDGSFALRINSRLEAVADVPQGCELIPDVEQLTQTMRRMLTEAEFRRSAAHAGPTFVAERFTWRHFADQVWELLSHANRRCWQSRPRLISVGSGALHGELATQYAQALQSYSSGNRAEAARHCRTILRQDPQYAEAAFLLGAVAIDENRPEDALLCFQAAIARQPSDARFHNAMGEAYRAMSRWSDAASCFQAALQLDPALGSAYQALGLMALDAGDSPKAAEYLRKAVEVQPERARGHLNLGRALQLLQDVPGAIASYREAIRLAPDYAIALNNLGAALVVQGEPTEAVTHLRRALEIDPRYPEANYNLGNALCALDNPAEGLKHYQEALRLRPDYFNAQLQSGNALESLGRREEALAVYENLVRAKPDAFEAWQRLSLLLMASNQWDRARAALEKFAACAGADKHADWFGTNYAYTKQMLCDWSTLAADREQLWKTAEAKLARGEPSGVPPFYSIVLAWPPERQLALARGEAASLATKQDQLRTELAIRHSPRSGGRLRVGYLSGDFYDHAVSHLTQGLFGLHDRQAIEAFAYSFGPDDGSSYRWRIQSKCEHFVDVRSLRNRELAKRIVDDRIDILVDMMGYSGFTRFEVMSLRAAPVRVSWLSYPGTTGSDYIDYVIGDRFVTPAEFAPFFSEKLVRLPHSYLMTDHEQPIGAPSSRREHGIPDGVVVFACVNNSYKFEPQTFDTWMRILQQTPGSILWLRFGGSTMEANLRHEAQSRGVNPDRLVFMRGVLPKPDHLARLALADLFLDTFNYNAHTTAIDSLWAGLPVLTCLGPTFASRVGGSLLAAVGLPELITTNHQDYERMAVRLACEPGELARLRARLAAQRTTSPLFDTARFVRNLERTFQAIWSLHNSGKPPQAIDVTE